MSTVKITFNDFMISAKADVSIHAKENVEIKCDGYSIIGGELILAYDRTSHTTTTVAPTTTTTPEPITIFYANINNSYTGSSHSGTLGNPFTFEELISHSYNNSIGNTYNIWGTKVLSTTEYTELNIHDNIWQAYNISVNGPFVIYSNGSISLDMVNIHYNCIGILKNCRIFTNIANNTSIDWAEGTCYNVLFNTFTMYVGIISKFYGCSIYTYAGFIDDTPDDLEDNIVLTDSTIGCTLGSPEYKSTMIKCIIPTDVSLTDKTINCQNLDLPSCPVYNAAKESYASSILLSGITTPPAPGNPPYTGYETDSWGNARTNIGAVYFG